MYMRREGGVRVRYKARLEDSAWITERSEEGRRRRRGLLIEKAEEAVESGTITELRDLLNKLPVL